MPGLHAVISTDDGTQLYLDKFSEFQEASHGVTALLDQYQRHTGRPFIFSARQIRLQASQEQRQLDDIGSAPRGARASDSSDAPVCVMPCESCVTVAGRACFCFCSG